MDVWQVPRGGGGIALPGNTFLHIIAPRDKSISGQLHWQPRGLGENMSCEP